MNLQKQQSGGSHTGQSSSISLILTGRSRKQTNLNAIIKIRQSVKIPLSHVDTEYREYRESFSAGIDRVIIGTAAIEDLNLTYACKNYREGLNRN
jgi:imidazole glycerol phosphate synthase subunit HisF